MPKIPSCLGGRYRIVYKIGGGGFGMVFEGRDLLTSEVVAIKVECSQGTYRSLLQHESRICDGFSRSNEGNPEIGFPKFYAYGTHDELCYMVMERLGPNIDILVKYCRPCLSLKSVLILSSHMLSRLERFHSKGFIHRDIKPHNYTMGWGSNGHCCYLIDFGLSTKFVTPEHDHIPFSTGKGLIGTPWFCSINAHDGNELSRRDDLESLFYVILYMLNGSLPWQRINGNNMSRDEQNSMIREQKVGAQMKALLQEIPPEFSTFYHYVRGLGFKKKPNYELLMRLFEGLMDKHGFAVDFRYDWVLRHEQKKNIRHNSVVHMTLNADFSPRNSQTSQLPNTPRGMCTPKSHITVSTNSRMSALALLRSHNLGIGSVLAGSVGSFPSQSSHSANSEPEECRRRSPKTSKRVVHRVKATSGAFPFDPIAAS